MYLWSTDTAVTGNKPRAEDARDCWRTPRDLFAALDARFNFVCDLAASADNALCSSYYSATADALTQDWPRVGWLWLNPPFSRLPEFMAKTHEQVAHGCCVVAITPGHRHEQDWFHRHVVGVASTIALPRGRVEYVPAPGIESSSPAFPSMVLIYDGKPSGVTMIRSLDALLLDREDGAA